MSVTLGPGITFSNGSTMTAPNLGSYGGLYKPLASKTRTVNTVYYNTSVRLLFVCINCSTTTTTNSFQVNGVEVAQNAGAARWNIAFIVPPGQSYLYYAPSGTNTIYWWTECF